MDSVSAPDLVESLLRSIGLYAILPFAVSVDVILVFFNDKYPSKLNYFSD